ncbi:MAG: S-layer homology domain-containing protein [Acidimicrobiia bacterium]|nr:S-layer homology domain-containing protein [Acidimicrobiia bacterium]
MKRTVRVRVSVAALMVGATLAVGGASAASMPSQVGLDDTAGLAASTAEATSPWVRESLALPEYFYLDAANSNGDVVGIVQEPTPVQVSAVSKATMVTAEGEVVELGSLDPPSPTALPTAINDQRYVVGTSPVPGGGGWRAFRWHPSDGMVNLGTWQFRVFTVPSDVDSAGQVVGTAINEFSEDEAFRWDPTNGFRPLRSTVDRDSRALAISDAGHIVGTARFGGSWEAFVWTEATGMVSLGIPDGYTSSRAVDVDDAGRVALTASVCDSWLCEQPITEAFRWDPATGLRSVGLEGTRSQAAHIAPSGQVVGWTQLSAPGPWVAWFWDPDRGAVALPTDDGTSSTVLAIADNGDLIGHHGLRSRRDSVRWRYLARFTDVGGLHPFAAAIEWADDEGVTQGFPDGTFRPGVAVERQAMAAFLHRLAGSPPPPDDGPAFADVPADHPFSDAIEWMAAEGLSTGTPQPGGLPLFEPAAPVSRQAMAAFLHRRAGAPAPQPGAPSFADVTSANPFHAAIQWVAQEGIATGTPQVGGLPLFEPGDDTTRQATVAFLRRATALDDAG